jgi:hypothetical protein
MHNLHYIIINAESADDAAESALLEIQDWGNENNWRKVGGVASEDGKDLIENHQDARWTLSGLKPDDALPDDNSYFAWAIADIWAKIDGDIKLPHHPYSKSFDLQVTLRGIALELLHSDCTNIELLWSASANLKYLHQIARGRAQREVENAIPEFYEWEFDECGLTDLTDNSEGAQRYLVMIDMHS